MSLELFKTKQDQFGTKKIIYIRLDFSKNILGLIQMKLELSGTYQDKNKLFGFIKMRIRLVRDCQGLIWRKKKQFGLGQISIVWNTFRRRWINRGIVLIRFWDCLESYLEKIILIWVRLELVQIRLDESGTNQIRCDQISLRRSGTNQTNLTTRLIQIIPGYYRTSRDLFR